MNSVMLQTATRIIMPLHLLFSIYMLLRGHNEPGGGFIGGLVAASALALYAIAFDSRQARQKLKIQPQTLIGVGLASALVSGILAFFTSQPFMTGLWGGSIYGPGVGKIKLGTPLLFDIGVYAVVIGITLLIVFTLIEQSE